MAALSTLAGIQVLTPIGRDGKAVFHTGLSQQSDFWVEKALCLLYESLCVVYTHYFWMLSG